MATTHKIQSVTNIRSLSFYASRVRLLAVSSLLLSGLLTSTAALADIVSVTAVPGSVTVSVHGATLPINITWRINRTEPAGPGVAPVTRMVTSPNATLQIDGSAVATLGSALTLPSTLVPGGSETLSLRESISVNIALARRIADSPAGSVSIVRQFSDTQQVGTGSVPVYSGAGDTQGLTFRRIDLTLSDGSRTDVIGRNEELRAVADISFRGNGILQAEWRLVDPGASLGGIEGRVLQVVRQSLVSSGSGRTRIVSPPLPTMQDGLYVLGFAVRDTSGALETPILRYFVLDKTAAGVERIDAITVRSPPDNTALSDDTLFSWQPLAGAVAYQVELFRPDATRPLAGKLVPGDQDALKLSAMTLDLLAPDETFQWQVRALDERGNEIGRSALMTVFTP